MRAWELDLSSWLLRAFVIGTALAGLSVSCHAQDVSAAPEQTLDDCKLIPDDGARLDCYDRVMKAGRENVRAPQAPASAPAPVAPAPLSPAPTATAAPIAPVAPAGQGGAGGASGAGAQASSGPASGGTGKSSGPAEEIKKLNVEVASATLIANGRMRFTTKGGAVWEQTLGSSQRLPKPGDRVRIIRTFMGGWLCRVKDWAAFECQQTQGPSDAAADNERITAAAAEEPATPPASAPAETPASSSGGGAASPAAADATAELDVTVASALYLANQQLLITTKGGAVWQQTSGTSLQVPKAGDAVAIKRNVMGGYVCRVKNWAPFDCRQLSGPKQSASE